MATANSGKNVIINLRHGSAIVHADAVVSVIFTAIAPLSQRQSRINPLKESFVQCAWILIIFYVYLKNKKFQTYFPIIS
jgi:hypothetical protein